MTTKPPPTVNEFSSDTMEKIAYASVSSIPTQEPNDQNRLGYHVWRWLTNRQGTLEEAIAESGARLLISKAETLQQIRAALTKQGIPSGL